MAGVRIVFSLVASVAALLGANATRAEIITQAWMEGATVSLILPDVRTYDQTLDVSIAIDTANATPSITLAFATFLEISDTLTLPDPTTWNYLFTSTEDPWNFGVSGTLGDATTPAIGAPGEHSWRFYDPINDNYTWLWSDYQDEVVWTLNDLVMHEQTTFTLTIQRFLAAPVAFTFDVAERLPAIPEPSSAILLGLGLILLASCSRRAAPRRR